MSCKPYDEASWGQTLQNYAAARTNNLLSTNEMHYSHQVAKNNQNHPASRVYNPILMKFNDPQVEQQKVQEETTMNIARMNIAKDKQLYYEQSFNLINNQSYMPESERKVRVRNQPTSRVTHNIVSMYPKEAHRNQEIGLLSTNNHSQYEVCYLRPLFVEHECAS
jgi:hypothetical protein